MYMTDADAAATIPAPPPGPGVRAPFVRPPTDGSRRRRNFAVLLTTLAVVVCCAGGIASFLGLIVFGNQMMVDQSKAAVTDYLTALRDQDFDRAYSLLCAPVQRQIGHGQFVRQQQSHPITAFSVGEPTLDSQITVPATLNPGTTGERHVRFAVAQNPDTADFEVCGGG